MNLCRYIASETEGGDQYDHVPTPEAGTKRGVSILEPHHVIHLYNLPFSLVTFIIV